MKRRAFAATVGCLLGAGCLDEDEPKVEAEIAFLELENHRRDEGYEFAVRIEDASEVVFEETPRLGPAGSGSSAVAFEDPVSGSGAYAVRVEAGDHSATADAQDLISESEPCLGLRFYLGQRTLHAEHLSFQRCD